MSKRPIILDTDRSAQSDQDSIVEWIRSTEVQLPKLSPMALQSLAFDHYDQSLKNGEPTAAKIAAGIMNLPELDQKTAAARRSEWSRSRCVEFLRAEIFRSNKELSQMAERTKSEAVKAAAVDAVYSAIISAYPHLKAEAADMAVKRKLELARNGKNGAAISKPEPSAPAAVAEARATTLGSVADVEQVQKQATQVANLIVLCIREVADYVVPQAQAAGITLDAQAQHALTMNMIITLSSGSKSHWKMPTERALK
jgi:hypothetical protein